MQIVILTDIFGKTQAIDELVKAIGLPCTVLSPYEDNRHFEEESTAYRYFSEQIGLDCYHKDALKLLQNFKTPYCLIGFSIGATVAWRISADTAVQNRPKKIIGFYGGQIRHYLELAPVQTIELIFPCEESHFCVESLIAKLAHKAQITQTPYSHGFMNRLSPSFDELGYHQFLAYIKRSLR